MNLGLKIKNYYLQNRVVIFGLLIMFLLTLIYCSVSTANVPIMDYWRYINQLVDKIFGGGVTFNDLWLPSAGHRSPLLYLLFIINILVFDYNAQIFIYTGLLMIIFNTLMIYKHYNKGTENSLLRKIGFLFIILALFNFNQWEILTLEFSLSFYTRIFLFCFIFIKVDSYLRNINTLKIYTIELGFLFISVICFCSGAYFPAMVGSIILIIILHYIVNYYNDKNKYIKYYFILILMIFIGSIFYIYNMNNIGGSSFINIIAEIVKNVLNGNFFKAFFIMVGSSLFHYEIANKYGSINFYIIVGIVSVFIYLFVLAFYFKHKRYKKNYFPLLLIVYCFINILLIFFARYILDGREINYLSSSRYVCETSLGLVGVLWILIDYATFKFSNKKKAIISLIFLGWISFGLIISLISETNVGPYRRIYKDNLIDIMKNIDNVNDEDLIGFQANDFTQVREGIRLMKKYNLGIFKND